MVSSIREARLLTHLSLVLVGVLDTVSISDGMIEKLAIKSLVPLNLIPDFIDVIFQRIRYLLAFTQVLMPIAWEFNPDLVLISAGFDAAIRDPLVGTLIG